MEVPAAPQMLELIRALPAGAPLLHALGQQPGVYLVGGAVRDLLLGGRPLDLDLVVDGDAAAVSARIGEVVAVHDRFGTSTVRLDGFTYDVARARRERYPHPGALPEVDPAGIEEDLRRRDFSVNAIAVALGGAEAGEPTAVSNALEDLDGRLLRVLHERSFIDDPTRLMRLARYASRLRFEIEPATRVLAADAIRAGALWTASGPRIGAELRLLVREPDPVAALIAIRELQLDRAIHPHLGLGDEELARRAMALLPEDGRPDRLALALAARAVPGPELRGLLDSLAFAAGDRDAIVSAAADSDELARRLSAASRPSEIARAVDGAGAEAVALAGALGPADGARAWLERLRHVALEVGGEDLLAAGVPEGPAVGRALDAALAAKLDGVAVGRKAELAAALRAARETG